MQRNELEARVYQVIDRIRRGQRIEDDTIEAKAEWIDAVKAARLIAAHANWCRGEPMLWLMSLDEKTGPTGADPGEFANWYSQLQSQFDEGVSPDLLHHINVPTDRPNGSAATVVALYFATDRAPYVVKNPKGGEVSLEVPVRRGIATHSAHRSELLTILAPSVALPTVEVLFARLRVQKTSPSKNSQCNTTVHGRLNLYVTPLTETGTVLPLHRTTLTFTIPGVIDETAFSLVRFNDTRSGMPIVTDLEATLGTPGVVRYDMECDVNLAATPDAEHSIVSFELQPTGTDRLVKGQATLHRRPDAEGCLAHWQYDFGRGEESRKRRIRVS